jgi:hypothetical protein
MNSAGYAERMKILEIEFSSREVYHYFDVPKKLFVDLLKADSAGKYFNQCIKGKFRFQKIS